MTTTSSGSPAEASTNAQQPVPIQTAVSSGVTTRAVHGGVWSLAGQVITLAASLVATPFVIRKLGPEGYGLLALINLVISQLTFVDAGMGQASTKFAAEAYAVGDSEAESAIVWSSLLITVVPTLVAGLALVLLAGFLTQDLLHLPGRLQVTSVIALRLAALTLIARNLAGVLNTPELVRLRMDVLTLINAGCSAIQIALTPVILIFGGGVIAAVELVAGSTIIMLLLHAGVSCRLQPRILRPQVQPETLRVLLRFGVAVAVSALANIALMNGEKFMLTRFGSVRALAHYSVAFTLASMLTVAPVALGQSLMPAFAGLLGEDERPALIQLYLRILKANLVCVPPLALLLVTVAKPFLTLWAGREYGQFSAMPFYILVAGLIFNLIAWVPYILLTAQGRMALLARYHLVELLPYLALAGFLTWRFGAIGAALAWSFRVVIGDLWLFWIMHRSERPSSPLAEHTRAYLLALLLLVLPVLIIGHLAPMPVTFGVAALSMAVYSVLSWQYVLEPDEQRWALVLAKGRR